MGQPAGRTIEIHRAASGKDLMEAMYFADMDEVQMRGLTRLIEANYATGYVIRVLFSSEALGISLTYSWFKKGFPLPRHSHSARLADNDPHHPAGGACNRPGHAAARGAGSNAWGSWPVDG